MAKPQIIIIKRVKGHGSHHAGAWKVAYADFVTAMMALFIVLWLMNTSEHTKKVIAGYFNDPMGKHTEINSDRAGTADALPFTRENIEKLKAQLQKQIQQNANLKDLSKQVEMTVTPEGLRIELIESKDGTFFDTGSTTLKPGGKGHAESARRQALRGAQPNLDRGPHRRTAVLRRPSSIRTGNSPKTARTSPGG